MVQVLQSAVDVDSVPVIELYLRARVVAAVRRAVVTQLSGGPGHAVVAGVTLVARGAGVGRLLSDRGRGLVSSVTRGGLEHQLAVYRLIGVTRGAVSALFTLVTAYCIHSPEMDNMSS